MGRRRERRVTRSTILPTVYQAMRRSPVTVRLVGLLQAIKATNSSKGDGHVEYSTARRDHRRDLLVLYFDPRSDGTAATGAALIASCAVAGARIRARPPPSPRY
jgi:hypothetical protein